MLQSLMLDSGAFSVWTKGIKIDFDQYLSFCRDHLSTPYMVNLDVIPGKPGDPRSLTPVAAERACQLGWENYQCMVFQFTKEQVVPVFHQGDDPKWLERYLSEEPGLMGISPANDRTVSQRLEWLNRVVRPRVVNRQGLAAVKMHGFAVTSFRLLQWEWYSVDSVSWCLYAAYGCVVVPVKRGSGFDYGCEPVIVNVSAVPPLRGRRDGIFGGCMGSKGTGQALSSFSPTVQRDICEYLDSLGLGAGRSDMVEVSLGYKLQRGKEVWASRDKRTVSRIVELGFSNSLKRRYWANLKYYQEVAKALGIKIFLGIHQSPSRRIMRDIKRPLLSYYRIVSSAGDAGVYEELHKRVVRRGTSD